MNRPPMTSHPRANRSSLSAALGAVLVTLLFSPAAMAQVPFAHDSFDYPDRTEGTDAEFRPDEIDGLTGGTGWSGGWDDVGPRGSGIALMPAEASGARIQPLGFTDRLGNVLATDGNQLRGSFGSHSSAVRILDLSAIPAPYRTGEGELGADGTEIWISFLAQNEASIGGSSRWSFLGLGGSEFAMPYLGKVGLDNGNWGIRTGFGEERIDLGAPSSAAVFFVARIAFQDGNDIITVWLDPDLDAEPAGGITATVIDFDFDRIYFTGRYSSDFDEIRIGASFASVTPHSNDLLVHEPFDYSDAIDEGTDSNLNPNGGIEGLSGGIGFGGNWDDFTSEGTFGTGNRATGIAGAGEFPANARTAPLAYTDSRGNELVKAGNQARTSFGSRSVATRQLAATFGVDGDTIWLSFLAQSAGNTGGSRGAGFGLGDNTGQYFGKPNDSENWGFAQSGAPLIDLGVGADTPVFYVARLDFAAGTDTVTVWLNPDLDSEPLLATGTSATTNLAPFDEITLAGRWSTDYDELRIGRTFAAVSPSQPSAAPVPEVSLTLGPDLAEATWSAATLRVSLSTPSTVPLTIPLVHSGTATTADWWTSPESELPSLTVPAGESSASAILLPLADALAEGVETLIISAEENGPLYTVGSEGSDSLRIADTPADDWRLGEFGAAANDPAQAGDELDLDGDGITVAIERQFRSSDDVPNGNPFTFRLDPVVGDDGTVEIRFPWWSADPGLRYRVEISDDLETWETAAALAETVTPDGIYDLIDLAIPARLPDARDQPFVGTDLGSPLFRGTFDYNRVANRLVIDGGGSDFADTSDSGYFVHQTLNGDGEVIARLVAQEELAGSKVGVMIRETLDADSAHVFAIHRLGAGIGLDWRSQPGGATNYQVTDASVFPPHWLRLVRSGDLFTAYDSPDGTNWRSMHSVTVTMGAEVYVGIGVSPFTPVERVRAEVDSVQVID